MSFFVESNQEIEVDFGEVSTVGRPILFAPVIDINRAENKLTVNDTANGNHTRYYELYVNAKLVAKFNEKEIIITDYIEVSKEEKKVAVVAAAEKFKKSLFSNHIDLSIYTVTLEVNGGELSSDFNSYEYGIGASLPIPTRNGYTFAGWYTSNDFSGNAVTEISTTDFGNKTYYAKWNAIVYNITFILDGGLLSNELSSYTCGVGAKLPTANKDHHTFVGWYTNADLSGEAVTTIGTEEIGNKTFYAKYEPITYSVTFVTNGGSEVAGFTYTYGEAVELPIPTKDGYYLAGWYESADFSGSAVTHINANDFGNKTFYAKWELSINTGTKGLTYELSADGTYYICKGIGTAAAESDILVADNINGKPVKEVYHYAFYECTNIRKLTIPNTVIKMGDVPFYRSGYIESITIPFIGDLVTRNENDSTQHPLGVMFGSVTYDGATSVSQRYLDNGSVKSYTYYIPSALREVNVTGGNILTGAFSNCKNLTKITIPNNITSIGQYAFYYCQNLTSINLPSSITSIGEYAFYYC